MAALLQHDQLGDRRSEFVFRRISLSRYLSWPADSNAIMASMMPLVGIFWIAVLPLKSGVIRSAQVVMLRPTRSGRIPSVSALKTPGKKFTQSVLAAEGPPSSTDRR